VKTILKKLGVYIYLKYLRKKYFPSYSQRMENSQIPDRVKFYSQFLKKGDRCFDVGANIGNRTEIFLLIGADVVAVEPQSDCSKMLELRFNNKIKIEKKALGESNKSGTIYISNTAEISSLSQDWIKAVSHSRFSNSQWNTKEDVQITTLDALIERYGLPAFCKIDVEGYEEEVLKGLTKVIPCISFEYTVPERMNTIIGCLDQLSRIGEFDCNYTIGEKMQLELPIWTSKDKLLGHIERITVEGLFGDIYIRFVK